MRVGVLASQAAYAPPRARYVLASGPARPVVGPAGTSDPPHQRRLGHRDPAPGRRMIGLQLWPGCGRCDQAGREWSFANRRTRCRTSGERTPRATLNASPTEDGSAVLPICSQFKGQQRGSPLPAEPVTGFLAANIHGGRYWDRTSDLFGVKQDAAPTLTCRNEKPQVGAGAVERRCGQLDAVQRHSAPPTAPHVLPDPRRGGHGVPAPWRCASPRLSRNSTAADIHSA